MNGIPSSKRITIWIEDKNNFYNSWDILIAGIEFYDEASQEAAKNLLSTPQFIIHEKKL